MNDLFSLPRTIIDDHYAVIAASGLTPGFVSGWDKASCQLVVSPVLGSRFVQLIVSLQADGGCSGNTGADQYFVSVLEGAGSVLLDDRRHRLEKGSYFYVPAGKDMVINSNAAGTKLLVIQRRYRALAAAPKPAALVAHERDLKPVPMNGADGVQTRSLLPDHPSFDMAVSVVSFEPGAFLPVTCTKPTEFVRLMLRGSGVFRLKADWHPVQTGDGIWTAPYCPHHFIAVGRQGAAFLCCEEANRDLV
jgi:(S)-ureidoglycine aminohydrolase